MNQLLELTEWIFHLAPIRKNIILSNFIPKSLNSNCAMSTSDREGKKQDYYKKIVNNC